MEEDNNIKIIREEIEKKRNPSPYTVGKNVINYIVNDMDHHPYTRWYRGIYYSSEPMIIEREAGWRSINNGCYSQHVQIERHPVYCPEPPQIDYQIDELLKNDCKPIISYR